MKDKKRQWKRILIKDVCESIIDCVNKTAHTVEGPTPYKMIRTTNVKAGSIDIINVRYVTKEIYDKWTRRAVPRKGDVILTREAPLGEVGMLRTSDTIFLGQRLIQYRADPEKLDNRFLLYSFQAYDLQTQIKSFGSGATVEHMRVPDAEKLTILLPDLLLQKKIASILSSYDDLIENNTRRIEILEQMAKLVYEEWFVKFRFPGHENVIMIPSELGEIPEGWKVKYLHEVAEIKYGFPFKSKLFTQESKESTPVIRIRDIINGFTMTFTSEEADEDYFVKNGDLLVGMDGDFHMSRWSGGRAYLNQRVVRFRPNLNNFSWYYLYLALKPKIKYFDDTITGTTVAHLSARDINSTKLVIPSEKILSKIYDILEPIHILELNLKIKNQNLRKTRDLLLPKLISGEIDVSDLDINIRNEVQES